MAKKANSKSDKTVLDKDTKAAESAKSKDKDKVKESKPKNETKKADKKAKDKNKGGIKKYFRDLRSEIKKVVWPSREKVINNTGVVLTVIVVCGLGLFGVDSLLAVAVNALLGIGA